MIEVSVSIDIHASAARAWAVVGGFDNLPLWLDMLASSQLEDGGRVRRLVATDGAVIVERLLDFNEAERRLVYSHIEAPDQVENYVGAMDVEALGADKARVTWSSSFVPTGGSADEAVARYEAIYGQGLAALKRLLEA